VVYIKPQWSIDAQPEGWRGELVKRSNYPIVSPEQFKKAEKIIVQPLTSECWMIQIEGLKACENCQYLNKPRRCGGKAIRSKLLCSESEQSNGQDSNNP